MTGMSNTALRRIGGSSLGLGLVACLVLGLVSVSTPTASGAGSGNAPGVAAAADGVGRTAAEVSAAVRGAAQPPGGLVESAKGYGYTEGSFSVSEDGAARYGVPIWTPDGRGEGEPSLSLSYNSRMGNGIAGVGWKLDGLPSIRRCSRTPAQDGVADGVHFDSTDAYCLDGMRLNPSDKWGKVQEYRTEKESYARVLGHGMSDGIPDYFQLVTKSGNTLSLGHEAEAQLKAYRLKAVGAGVEPESEEPVTVEWATDRIEDRNGNSATVGYRMDPGAPGGSLWGAGLVPETIDYGPNRRVVFTYQIRPDVIDRFEYGVHLRQSKRLARVAVYGGPEGGQRELLRTYELDYQNDSITGRSRLMSVQACDPDDVCLLAQDFSYSTGSYDFDDVDTGVDVSLPIKNKFVVGDINGDGRDDVLYPNKSNVGAEWVSWQILFSTGDGFSKPTNAGIDLIDRYKMPELTTVDVDRDGRMDVMAKIKDGEEDKWVLYESNGQKFVRSTEDVDDGTADEAPEPAHFADLDGNGLPDYMSATWGPDGRGPWYYRLNSGKPGAARWAEKVTTDKTAPVSTGGKAFDLDGDGGADMVGWNAGRDNESAITSFGLSAAGEAETPVGRVNLLNSSGMSNPVYADINGDGLQDAVYPYTTLKSQLNSGRGFGPVSPDAVGYEPPGEDVDGGVSTGVRATDFDGDGADELLVYQKAEKPGAPRAIQLWRWESNKWVRDPLHEKARYGQQLTQPLDIDGNGVLDIVYSDGDNVHILKRAGVRPDLMTRGGSVLGERVEVDYTTLADRDVHTPCTAANYPMICAAAGSSVVSQHRERMPEAKNGWASFDHSYEGARMDLRGRGWLGFAEHTVLDRRNGTYSVTTYDNATREGGTDGAPEIYPYAMLPKTVTTTVPGMHYSHALRRVVTNEREVRRHIGGGYAVELRHVTETEQERAVGESDWRDPFQKRFADIEYDGFGNQVSTVTRADFGRRTTVETTYEDDTHRRFGLASKVETTGCPPGEVNCTTRETTFDYDEAGNRVETVVEPNGAEDAYLKTTTDYGESGEVRKVTVEDKKGEERPETFDYDDDLLYPTTVTNARGHTTTTKTHSGLGLPLEVTDPNGVTTTMKYDTFGRLRETNYADGDFERISHFGFLGDMIATTTLADGRETKTTTRLGRQRERRVRTFDGKWSRVFTKYDEMGLVASESRPTTSAEPTHTTTFLYDRRGRLLSQKAPDGSAITHSYDGVTTTTRDARGATTRTTANPDGEVATRIEPNPETDGELITRYFYGVFGDLSKVVAPDGTTQTMDYDVLGRRTLHSDPSAGATETTYNGFGETVTETDANDDTTTYTYDVLGRVEKVTSPDGTESRRWDAANHGVGLLASAKSADGVVTRYTYDELARTTSATWTIDGSPYRIDYDYDEIGRHVGTTYPQIPGVTQRFEVGYEFNEHGYVTQVTDAADDKPFWTAQARNVDGNIEREEFGNGLVTTRGYSPTTGLVEQIRTIRAGEGLVENTSYGYDDNRNVAYVQDGAHARRSDYTYDSLNRLVGWKYRTDEAFEVAFDYDKLGNLEEEAVAGQPDRTVTYTYGEGDAPPHALTSMGEASYGYDKAGQQISAPGRTIDYNQLGLPARITDDGKRTDFAYDSAGARVLKRGPGLTEVSVPGVFERRTIGGEIRNVHHVVVAGQTVAQVTRTQKIPNGAASEPEVAYIHGDRQASTMLVSDADGKPLETDGPGSGVQFYDPFGRRIDADYVPLEDKIRKGPRQGYTGQGHDDELALMDMRGRIYQPATRRFLTPDPLVSEPYSSQSLNRYAYVGNNPATFTDPSGYQRCRIEGSNYQCEQDGETIDVTPVDVSPEFDLADWSYGWYTQGWSERGPGDIRATGRGLREFGRWFVRGMQAQRAGTSDHGMPGADQTTASPGAAVAGASAAGGVLGRIGKWLQGSVLRRALNKAIETGLHFEGEHGFLTGSMDSRDHKRFGHEMRTKKQQLNDGADVETQPDGGKKGGGGKLRSALGVLNSLGLLLEIPGVIDTYQRAKQNGRSYSDQVSVDIANTPNDQLFLPGITYGHLRGKEDA